MPAVGNTEIAVLETEDGALRLAAQGDVGHLEDPEYQAHEPPRETPDFNTDMSFYLLRWIEYGELMAQAVECIWQETGDERPFNRDVLLNDAAILSTTVGYAEQAPAGFLQMGAETGWITLLCTHPGCRRAGLGTQLLGQAVEITREKGGQLLHIALPKRNLHRQFFLNRGFSAMGELQDGREVLEKNIALSAEFLSE